MKRKYDEIEEFILKHRDEMDDAYPSLKVWSEIDKSLSGHEATSALRWRGRIIGLLAVLLIISIGVAFWLYQRQTAIPVEKNMLFAEVESMEHYYQSETNRLIQTVGFGNDLLVNTDLIEIDKNIAEIKAEMGDIPPGKEELALKALLESYRTKLLIIERILDYNELSQPLNKSSNENKHNI